MIEIIREFVVKEEAQGQFELAYGPGGAWSKLFAKAPGFRGTMLLRDIENPRRYLTVDLWESLAQRDRMLADLGEEYASLNATFHEWTESESEIGVFRVQAEGTVRPRGKVKRGAGVDSPRGRRRLAR